MATIVESLKKRLFKTKEPKTYSDYNDDDTSIIKSVKSDYEGINPNIGFYDDNTDESWSQKNVKINTILQQADLIDEYRRISESPECRLAIDEIVNEAIFAPGSDETLKISVDSSKLTEKTCEVIIDSFNDVCDIFDVEMNISPLFEKWYTDGQLAVQIVYDNKDLSRGIVGFNVLETKNLTYIKSKNVWKYATKGTNSFTLKPELKFSDDGREYVPEEVIFLSSEIYDISKADPTSSSASIIKSHLHGAIKVHNQLTTLEDMLVPMRFSRSVSRRVFNVDVGDLPATKAESALNRIKDKFKYKKFYDVEKGTISNQMHISSLVEDYWFQNRDGAKGTQVETLDESGNLGELGDITYFRKKLYTSLKIPQSRVVDEMDGQQAEFDYSSSSVSREEIKFFAFIQKLRKQFLRLFRDSLKRQLLYTGVISSEDEWNTLRKHIKISFTKENIFLETMQTELMTQKIGLYSDIEEMIGKEFSKNWARKNVLRLSDDEIKTMQEEIKQEKDNGEYGENEDGSKW